MSRASKRIEIDSKFFRKRKGKLVEIPPEWVGKVTHPQTIKDRKGKGNKGRKYKSKAQR